MRTGATQAAAFVLEDVKIARKAKGEHVLRLGIYAELLEAVFGFPVQSGTVHVAAGKPEIFDLRQLLSGSSER